MGATWLWLIPALPLLGATANGILHAALLRQRARGLAAAPGPASWAGVVATAALAAAFAVAVAAFLTLRSLPPEERVLSAPLMTWMQAGGMDVSWSLLLDPLSCTMALVVTGVGALIHLYSIGYMHGDAGYARYFAYLNLFAGAMLLLVLGDSLPALFLGWEGVGLCSYLLIGFWYEDGAKADAARKAFIVNRIGDFGFLVGMFLLYQAGVQSLRFDDINAAAAEGRVPAAVLTAAGLCLFAGCCGKSAQIPLYTWLPDAMAGPTPVSALIHAATMVTAGVYLVARMSPLFAHAPGVLPVIAAVGAVTALFSATIGLGQRDIKKVLAYSTVSQLGYMFLGLGVGAFGAAIFHLVTHAFFKALLFLGSGSVIHALGGEQDLFRMGGLRSRIRLTCATMAVGACALAGVPLFAGFFSKDEILLAAASAPGPGWLLWGLGIAGAALTALYTGRLLALAFLGEPRFDARKTHPHEAPPTMTVPLVVLAVLSVLGGLLGIPHLLHPLEDWLHPVLGEAARTARGAAEPSGGLEAALLLAGSAVAAGGLAYGIRRFSRAIGEEERRTVEPGWMRTLGRAWYVDEIYDAAVVRPASNLARGSGRFDLAVVDGAVNLAARAGRGAGAIVRRVQTGATGHYAMWFTLGASLLLLALWLGARP